MKKRGILNAQLSYLIAALGHKDLFMIGDAGMPIPEDAEVEYMPHEDLKKFSSKCRFAIRTGEFSPYPNVILRAGVVF